MIRANEQVIPAGENLGKALLLMGLIAASFWIANGLHGAPSAAKWLAIAALGVANVVLLTGLGVLAHDAVHRVLFRSAFWNELWGGLLSALTLIPFQANRQFHLTHHAYAHQPGLDPEEAMHDRPFALALAHGANLGLKEQYRLYLGNLRRGEPKSAWRAAQDTFFIAGAAALYFVAVPALGLSIWATVVPTIVAFPPVFAFRALSDHYGLPPVQNARGRQEEVTGWVVLTSPWLEWLWSHVNYHEVHHKYPYLSHRYLPQVYAATRERYPYRVARGYWRSLLDLRKRNYYGG
jgi:fatty acid desaturase